jgi:hypothetical protein
LKKLKWPQNSNTENIVHSTVFGSPVAASNPTVLGFNNNNNNHSHIIMSLNNGDDTENNMNNIENIEDYNGGNSGENSPNTTPKVSLFSSFTTMAINAVNISSYSKHNNTVNMNSLINNKSNTINSVNSNNTLNNFPNVPKLIPSLGLGSSLSLSISTNISKQNTPRDYKGTNYCYFEANTAVKISEINFYSQHFFVENLTRL